MEDKPVKVTFRLDKEVAEELKATIPWGSRERLANQLIAAATGAIKSDGTIIYGAILTGEFKITLSPIVRRRMKKHGQT